MDKLIEYTNGSIISTIIIDGMIMVLLIIGLVAVLIWRKKSKAKASKDLIIAYIIITILMAMLISATVGYYLCMYTMLT